ncbi:MAG: asparagine--tRNA ligase [Candidatus Hodarchaeales archaeon]|jgi:asparaginyl-tRNA synthetase
MEQDSKWSYIKDLISIEPEMLVHLRGWVHQIRKQGKLVFIILRDPTGYLQCVVKPNVIQDNNQYESAVSSARETTIVLSGHVKKDKRAPHLGIELQVTSYKVLSPSSTDIENEVRVDSAPEVMLDKRHLVLRGPKTSTVMKLRSETSRILREFYFKRDFHELTPPTLVKTQVEGGSTLFPLKYFDQEAFLTQSSQLYLETAIFSLGNVYCVLPSYRAEKSRTRRHLTEYTHVEGEMAFYDFEDLLDHLEDMIVYLTCKLDELHGDSIREFNPRFKPFDKRPFMRLDYSQAIEKLREYGIKGENDKFLEFGDDISEKPEREIVDKLDQPVFLIKFPTSMKPFYMKRDPEDSRKTMSVDLLIPGVGEIVGGSQREDDYNALMKQLSEEGLDPAPYYWYTDLRKYGSCVHSGYGFGLERFLMWLIDLEHIREACLFPRLINRLSP